MTVPELIIALYEGSYEQDELNPYINNVVDDASAGTQRMFGFINRAIRTVSTWKFPNGIRIRFAANEGNAVRATPETGHLYFENDQTGATSFANGYYLIAGSITPGSHAIDLGVAFVRPANGWAGWTIRLIKADLTETSYLVQASAGSILYTTAIPDATFDTAIFAIYPTSLSVGVNGDIQLPEYIQVRDVVDMDNQTTISRGVGNDGFPHAWRTVGIPTEYVAEGNRLHFNAAVEQPITLRLRYWKYPTPVASVNDYVDLPDSFHEAVYLVAKSELLRRIGEVTEAAASWRMADSLMITLRTQSDFGSDGVDSRLYPEAL